MSISVRPRPVHVALAFLLGVLAAHLLSPGVARGEAGPADFTAVIARVEPGVAHVTTLMEGERAPHSRDDAVGAGFVYSADGLVITSRHTLQGARRVFVSFEGRPIQEARVVGVDDATDVAVLKVEAAGLTPLPVGSSSSLRKGQWVLAAGSPFHLPRSFSVGIVGGLGRSGVGTNLRGYEDFIQTDAAANVGNSGGPLLDASGAVVGMMTAILSRTGRSEGVGLAVPIEAVLASARRLASGQAAPRPSLGVIVRETPARGGAPAGLEVTRFQPRSSAREAGLEVGDLLLQVDGTAVPRVADLQRVIWAKPPGSAVDVVFLRRGQTFRVPVPLR